jgi:MFS family permease
MRGRYMAFFGFSFAIPGIVGTLLAGLIMDNADPRMVWYAAGLLGIIATSMYVSLHARVNRNKDEASDPQVSMTT